MQYCLQPNCSTLVQKGRCDRHRKQHYEVKDQRRGRWDERYGNNWQSISRFFRQQHPICGERYDGTLDTVHSRCASAGLTIAAECVDHIVPIHKGGTNEWANLMSACKSCNSSKGDRVF